MAPYSEIVGEVSGHEGPRLVTDADDFGVGSGLGGHLLQVGPDGFADGGVHTTSQASVRGDGHKFLGCSLAQLTSAWSKKMEAASLSRLPLQEALPPSDPSGVLCRRHHLHRHCDLLDVCHALQPHGNQLQVGHPGWSLVCPLLRSVFKLLKLGHLNLHSPLYFRFGTTNCG